MTIPTIKLKKSSILGRKPDSADLAYGELAINYNDGKLYYKNSSNIVKTFLDSGNTVDLIDSAYIQARQSNFDSADFNSMFSAKSTTNLSEGTNKYYTKARADSDDKFPTTFTYTAGTTSGPTGSLTGTNLTAISFAAIPSAGASASGIITTDTQTIAGAKTFSSTISGSIDGNAATATTLATGRNFSLTGEVTAPTISFNGSGAVALSTTIATDAVDSSNILALSVSSGKIQSGAVTTAKFATGAVDSAALGALSVSSAKLQASIPDSKLATISTASKVSNSATTATNLNTASTIVARDASGNFTAGTITAALTGNASTATALATSRNLWGQSFNGAANVTGSLTSVGDITGTGAVTLTSTAGVLTLAATSNNNIVAKTNGSERMRIDSAGQVGIGTISPATKLDVAGVASAISFENPQTITSNYTITTSRNAMNAGPITIDGGVTVTVPSGSVWTIV